MKLMGVVLMLLCVVLLTCSDIENLQVYEIKEIILYAQNAYDNPYTDVMCGVQLTGPGFSKKVYGFWDGDSTFRVRVAAVSPGAWSWQSFSQPEDPGLSGKTGRFRAVSWSETELQDNPNRRGYLQATDNGHALQYTDGTPFFMVGDTWWAASTWRFPFKNETPDRDYQPGPGIGFEQAVAFRKGQGYNTIAMIAAFPNWKTDAYPPEYMDENGIGVRQAWEKNGANTAKDMHDEDGDRPFMAWSESDVISDYNRINPDYFKNLDRKLQYLQDNGFVTFLETVRRDHGPSWKACFDWPESYSRYVQYIIARYAAYNIMFSGIHLDWINEHYSLSADEFNQALTYHQKAYGDLPYGQPHTILIDGSTLEQFGHAEEAPWLTMHAVGNVPRNHGFYPMLEELYNLQPPYPAANLEPYYPGWDNPFHNTVAGERPEVNSGRDNYFARAQMYGSVLSGGLAGHIYGTGAYDGNTTGEPKEPGDRPYIWEGLNYPAGAQMSGLNEFILSEGGRFQDCIPSRQLLHPHKAENAPENGLDGWSFLLLSPQRTLGFLYFENACEIPDITGLIPETNYTLHWYHPQDCMWLESGQVAMTDTAGVLSLPAFPDDPQLSGQDWALKIKRVNE